MLPRQSNNKKNNNCLNNSSASRRKRIVAIASFFTDVSVHCMNGQFLALIHSDLPTTFNGLVLMVEDSRAASAAFLLDLPDISVSNYVNLIAHSDTDYN